MRLQVITLFLLLQALSFGIWTIFGTNTAEVVHAQSKIHAAAQIPIANTSDTYLKSINFTAKNTEITNNRLIALKRNQILDILSKLPKEHTKNIEKIVLDYNENAGRGLGNGRLIVLKATSISSKEMTAVMIHEMGHVADLGYLSHTKSQYESEFHDGGIKIWESDPSLDYYRLSWEDERTLKRIVNNTDFVSGYAMTDCFEDFAETYIYYLLHGNEFRIKTSTSNVLFKKYNFMKEIVFDGQEFDTGSMRVEENSRPWDITKLSYNFD